tara:strand:- start:2796 stop:5543 length:2748 start_codon:yes stop_codon:yes gene_type:complete
MLVLVAAMGTQGALAQEAAAEDEVSVQNTVVVTGFRNSLSQALDQKKLATGAIDAIVAEDIADFPDLNLAESLQRIPGVAITRSNGEGKNITVRGLSGQYTRVRVNGMETRAGTGDSNGRDFDFNMFASELFNSIIVHKTASAEMDEGSLGAVVDLNTGRAFNYDEGTTFVVGAQGQYNDLSEDTSPRLTGLFAYNDPAGLWGVTGSAAYSKSSTVTNTGNSVRWQKASFNSVLGVDCGANPNDAGCLEVSDAFHARIPRYGTNEIERDRFGATLGLQFRPSDKTLVTLDGMFATFDQTTDFQTLEVLFRGNEGGMDVTDYTIQAFPDRYGDGNDTIIAMDVDNAWVRSENYHQDSESDFTQFTAQVEHEFTDRLSLDALFGTSRSEGRLPRVTTLMYDDRDYDGFSYDYSNSTETPTLAYNGPDVTDGTNFTLTEVRDQVHKTETGFDNAQISLTWDFSDALEISGGVTYKKFTLDTEQRRRDGTVCGLGLYDCDLDDDGTNDIIGAPGTAALTEQFTYTGETGAGSAKTWASPSLKGWTDLFDYYSVPLSDDQGRIRAVEEKSMGAFIQLAGEIPVGEMRLMYDAGVRYVETEQSSSGFNSGVYVTVDRPKYDDTLPSANVALWVTDEFVLRGSAAKVMSRPELSQLTPGGSVDSFNLGVNFQNPNLDPTRATTFDASAEWYFAEDALLSLAVFSKDIDSFPIRELRTGTFASTGLPVSVIAPTSPASQNLEGTCGNASGCWEISELTNGPGAKVKGFEVGFQLPFDSVFNDLPMIVKNMGIVANYTYVDSDVDYNFRGTTISERILGLSNTSYNATIYYEDEKLSARVSVANRDEYLDSGPDRSGNLWEGFEESTYIDFSSTYSISEQLDLTFEALNLTDEAVDGFVDIDARRRNMYDKTGRNFLLGARYKF